MRSSATTACGQSRLCDGREAKRRHNQRQAECDQQNEAQKTPHADSVAEVSVISGRYAAKSIFLMQIGDNEK
jgi:hypothetical protein